MAQLKAWLETLFRQAVEDYKKAILRCLEASYHEVILLDCGCDDGEWTVTLAGRVGPTRLLGIEMVAERGCLAREKEIEVIGSDLNKPFALPDNSLDIIHANQVIEHLADTDNFIKEIRRTLKPGGYAIICTENLASWHNIFALTLGWQPFSLANVCETKWQIGNPLGLQSGQPMINPKSWQHLRVFAYRGLKEVFIEHGLEVIHYEGSGYYPLPNTFSKLDPRHAAFLTIKVRKPLNKVLQKSFGR
ncbi:class I SAM-dependent methyltransferase [Anaerolineales bacterium HSG24]|nr:class I SAM-dependent methyltransferase [Anaerolineales bacterium HSG24]